MKTGRVSVTSSVEGFAPPELETRHLRICVVSEGMSDSPDEGIKKFATRMVEALGCTGDVLGISLSESCDLPNIVTAKANRLFLNADLWSRVRSFEPDVICYIPTASDTIFSHLRLKLLSSMWRTAATVLIALQPRPRGGVSQWLSRKLAPDLVLVQSKARSLRLERAGLETSWIPSGVDLERFTPVSTVARAALRKEYGLPEDAFLVLHVGHVTRNRNLTLLTEIQREYQVVMVTGNSVGEDQDVRRSLDAAGVIVFDRYLEAVEEIYQSADCFLFPVISEQGSIEIPLSVLEAMACNLPVVSTRFGGIEDLVGPSGSMGEAGLFLADEESELPSLVHDALHHATVRTREIVQPYSWPQVAARLLKESARVIEIRKRDGK